MTQMTHTLRAYEHKLGRPKITSLVNLAVVVRAAIVAVVLGSILTLTNQQGAIFADASIQVLSLSLVYLTPFIVVTISQALGIRRAMTDAQQNPASTVTQAGFLTTSVSHGIPLRSLVVGLTIGSVNTLIMISSTLLESGNLADMPMALIGQAFVLPMLFGLLSQAISYRRATRVISAQFQTKAQPATI